MQRLPRAAALGLAAAAALAALAGSAAAQTPPLKVGLMLPYTGTYAALGDMIEKGFKLYVQEQGGKLGGREIQYFKVDDESEPSKAIDNANKLVKRDQVDVLVGTVHSGVALAMARVAKESNTLLIVPNAGAGDITGSQCAPNIFRSSFSNWQPGYGSGVVAAGKGYKRAITITWAYAAGAEAVKGFTEGFEKGGGKVIKDLALPFPNVEFQALLTEIAAHKPDVVFAFFAGGGAPKFLKDYDAAGLKKSIPFIASGGMADGRSLVAALALGAEGINMGTRFIATQEAPVHAKVKQALLEASELDTRLVLRPLRNTERVLDNAAVRRLLEKEKRLGDRIRFEDVIQEVAGVYPRVMQEGALDAGAFSCGMVVGLIHDIPTVKELIDRIMAEAEGLIRQRLARLLD